MLQQPGAGLQAQPVPCLPCPVLGTCLTVLWAPSQAPLSLETGQTSTGLEFGFEYGLKYLNCLEGLDVLELKWNVRVIC